MLLDNSPFPSSCFPWESGGVLHGLHPHGGLQTFLVLQGTEGSCPVSRLMVTRVCLIPAIFPGHKCSQLLPGTSPLPCSRVPQHIGHSAPSRPSEGTTPAHLEQPCWQDCSTAPCHVGSVWVWSSPRDLAPLSPLPEESATNPHPWWPQIPFHLGVLTVDPFIRGTGKYTCWTPWLLWLSTDQGWEEYVFYYLCQNWVLFML